MNEYEAQLAARRRQIDDAIAEKLKIKAERKKQLVAKSIKLRVDADGNVYGPNGTLLGKASK